jgi:vitamin B12 transporter
LAFHSKQAAFVPGVEQPLRPDVSHALLEGLHMNISTAALTTVLLASTVPAFAADSDIIISASRVGGTARDQLGTAVSVLNKDQIEARQTRLLADVLRDTPGLSVSRQGGTGGLTTVRMRGAEGNHTLVLLDGVDISDPFQGEFDFGALTADGVGRIEILRGSQSALYGSDAIGGVINIVPDQARDGLRGVARAEGGSFGTWRTNASAGYGTDRADIMASIGAFKTQGINTSRFGTEKDGADNVSLLLNGGVRLTEALTLRGVLRYAEAGTKTDPQDFAFPATPTQGLVIDGDEFTRTRQLSTAATAQLTLFEGAWVSTLRYAYADGKRRNYTRGAPSFFTNGDRNALSFASAGKLETGDVTHRVTGAIDWKRETYRNVALGVPTASNALRAVENTGLVLAYDVAFGAFDAGLAYRHDINQRFRNADTYRAQASYRIEASGTRLRGSAGSGIKNPTNIELFGFNPNSFVGNPNLTPEKSEGWDLGLEQKLFGDKALVSITYFQATLRDEIFTTFTPPTFIASPANRTTKSRRKGVEITLDAEVAERFSINGAYTYVDSIENNVEELRRPKHTGSLSLAYRFAQERARLGVNLRYTGPQQDSEFISATPSTRVRLAPYTLVNMTAAYDVMPMVRVFGRIENLFDARYEDVFSYRAPGLGAYAGVEARF